jgi:hypothetical protein
MTFWSPDGTGWVERDWVTGFGATISDSIALSADARSYHEFIKSGYFGQAGYTCSCSQEHAERAPSAEAPQRSQ